MQNLWGVWVHGAPSAEAGKGMQEQAMLGAAQRHIAGRLYIQILAWAERAEAETEAERLRKVGWKSVRIIAMRGQ